jgi:hypothetical protein
MRDEERSAEQLAQELAELHQSLCQCTAALRSRNQDLDDIARYIVGEFRGPLGAIVGYAELLEEDHLVLSPDDLRHSIKTIKENGRKLGEMVNVLLLLANSRRLFDNIWYAAYLASMDETSLSQWATDLQVAEVYRFTCLPASSAPLVVRVWMDCKDPAELQAVAKLGSARGDAADDAPREEVSWTLDAEEWGNLMSAVEATSFWSDDSSLEQLGWMRMVGTGGEEWVFEGWRDGQYKARAVWNPDFDRAHAAHSLGRSFADLLPGQFALEMAQAWTENSWNDTDQRLNGEFGLGEAFTS